MKLFLLLTTGLTLLLGSAVALPRDSRPKNVVRQDDATAARPIRIMPFGASIVEITCWRAYLWKKLQDAGHTNLDFVGSRSGPSSCTLAGAPVTFDPNNEGHSGALATQYAAAGNLTTWLAAAAPVDMILIHLGTNDAASHVAPSATITAYDTLLGEMRASNPNMKIVVSTLIPIAPKVFGKSVSDGIETLNAMLRVWVKRNGLVLVENFFGFDAETMTTEGEHPNESGSVFMAGKFFPIVEGLLGA